MRAPTWAVPLLKCSEFRGAVLHAVAVHLARFWTLWRGDLWCPTTVGSQFHGPTGGRSHYSVGRRCDAVRRRCDVVVAGGRINGEGLAGCCATQPLGKKHATCAYYDYINDKCSRPLAHCLRVQSPRFTGRGKVGCSSAQSRPIAASRVQMPDSQMARR